MHVAGLTSVMAYGGAFYCYKVDEIEVEVEVEDFYRCEGGFVCSFFIAVINLSSNTIYSTFDFFIVLAEFDKNVIIFVLAEFEKSIIFVSAEFEKSIIFVSAEFDKCQKED